LNKGSSDQDSNKEFNHKKESDDKCKPKNDLTSNSMSVEQIQNLIADVVKAHLGEDSHKSHLYKKPYTKKITLYSSWISTTEVLMIKWE